MEFIGTVLAGPLPVAVSTVVALACLTVFWYFVLPLLDEVKSLRETNSDLQRIVTGYVEDADQRDNEVAELLAGMSASLMELEAVGLASLSSQLDAQIKMSTTNHGSLQEINNRVQIVSSSLATHIESEITFGKETSREIERLSRNLEQLTRQLSDISERQSQVTGILTGMTMAKTANRSL